MNNFTEQVITQILVSEMGLPESNVWVRSQNRKIQNDQGLYLVVGMNDAMPISTQMTLETLNVEGSPVVKETQRVNIRQNIQIDIFGRTNDAITRRFEVLAALRSIYSQQAQEANAFKIVSLPNSFTNTGTAEGSSEINRFSIIISCFSWYKKTKVVSTYYDDFTARGDVGATIDKTKGILEFEINQATPNPDTPP